MSISSKAEIISRVKHATPQSPLALFVTPQGVDCVFANTVEAQVRKTENVRDTYIATVHNAMPLCDVSAVLRAHT